MLSKALNLPTSYAEEGLQPSVLAQRCNSGHSCRRSGAKSTGPSDCSVFPFFYCDRFGSRINIKTKPTRSPPPLGSFLEAFRPLGLPNLNQPLTYSTSARDTPHTKWDQNSKFCMGCGILIIDFA
jgi:hypothetical protein